MENINIGKSNIKASRLILGCMRMAACTVDEAKSVIEKSYSLGINHFNHADIYGGGKSEEIFAKALKLTNIKREDIIIQYNCGIKQGQYDFSYEHIMTSVDNILIHRPDTLMEPKEVAKVFNELKSSGKVREFGLSNCNPLQIELIQSVLDFPIIADQVQFGPAHTPMIDSGLNVNMKNLAGINRDEGLLEYTRFKNITLQAWSPFQVDLEQGLFIKHPEYLELTKCLERIAKEKMYH